MKKKNAAAETTHTAADNAAALLHDAKDRIAPILDQGKEKLAPLASGAKSKGAQYAHHAAVAVAPAVAAAKGAAKNRYDHLLPRITDALEDLANNPNAREAQARGLAAIKALQGDLQLSKKDRKRLHKDQLSQIKSLRNTGLEPAKPKRRRKILPLLFVGALSGAAYVAWKKFFGPQETDWQTHTATSYQAPATQPKPSQSFGEPVDAPAGGAAADTEDAYVAPHLSGVEATEPADDAPLFEEPTIDNAKYGEGAFVGTEPPEGYRIKGNERSMKYHTPNAGGYERTIADVWFDSEAAAESAGFTKAQR